MTIRIQRGRQFNAGDATSQLFDDKGNAGTYLKQAADKLVGQGVSVTLKGAQGDVTLATADDWSKFIKDHAGKKADTASFADKFEITFGDFINLVDDAAASDEKGVNLDLRPTSELATNLSLDKIDHDYGTRMLAGAKVNLTGANGATGVAESSGVPGWGLEVGSATDNDSWERDRAEQESWADYKFGDGASRKFRDNTGPAPFVKLHEPKWDDAESMAMVDTFALPVHLEVSATKPKNDDGTTRFQDGSEMFRETYFDDKAGSLAKSGASVRARVRFDDDPPYKVKRVLIQAKEGRQVGADGRSSVHKFEKRFEGDRVDENKARELLVSGKDESGQVNTVARKLYGVVKERGQLPADSTLRLEPKYIVLQKRRRTHLQLDSQSTVQSRRDALQKQIDDLKTQNQPVPDGMTKYLGKLDQQLQFLKDAGATLQKYGQWMPSGECFIVSADRYSVFDPAARKENPNDVDDEVGRIGRGLHVEAEWDSASSDPFEKAIASIDKQLGATPAPANAADLQADKTRLEEMREVFRKDVAATVEVLKARLASGGLEEDPTRKSKDERAADFAASPNRPTFWL
jgi:hypothetical protein